MVKGRRPILVKGRNWLGKALARRFRRNIRRTQITKVPTVHKFARTQQYSMVWNPFTQGGATGIGYYANNNITAATPGYFTLDSLPDYFEFTALFDSYRIEGIKMTWTYSHNSSENSSGINMPMLHWAYDRDDGTPVTSINALMQYQTYKTRRMDKAITVFVKPRVSAMIYQGAVGTAYSVPNKPIWIDCGDPDAQHFGIKWIVEAMGDAENVARGVIRLTCKFFFSTKSTI